MNLTVIKRATLCLVILVLCQCKKKDPEEDPQPETCMLTTITNQLGVLTIGYNTQGQITRYDKVYTGDLNGITGYTTIEYNSNGQLSKSVSDNNPNSLPNGMGVTDGISTWEYDQSGRLIKNVNIYTGSITIKDSLVYEYVNDTEFYCTNFHSVDSQPDTTKRKYVYSDNRKKLSIYSQPFLSSMFDGKVLSHSRDEFMIEQEYTFTDVEVKFSNMVTNIDPSFVNMKNTVNNYKIYFYSYDDDNDQVIDALYYETIFGYEFDEKGNLTKVTSSTNFNNEIYPEAIDNSYSEDYAYTCQ